MASSNLKALVFGASGITGWAIVKEALEYPTPTSFSRIIGLTNRPLSLEDSYLEQDSRLLLKSGVDLSGDVESIVKALSDVGEIRETTHVYFTAYVHKAWGANGSAEQIRANVELLLNSLKAVERLCPDLQFITWATGGKWYGFEHAALLHPQTPFRESDPRVSAPYSDHIFYYNQHDAITAFAKGKKWKFADVRPDAIVGFVPNNNPMNLAQPMALYLSLWHSLNPKQPVPFPGTGTSYRQLHTDVFQDQLAKFHIYVSLHPEKTAGGSFNIADADKGNTWESVWPGICSYFGLEATGPADISGEAWVKLHEDKWALWEESNDLKAGLFRDTAWGFLTTVAGEYSEFDRSLDISLARDIGFTDSADHVQSYHRVFDRMRGAKMIPSERA